MTQQEIDNFVKQSRKLSKDDKEKCTLTKAKEVAKMSESLLK